MKKVARRFLVLALALVLMTPAMAQEDQTLTVTVLSDTTLSVASSVAITVANVAGTYSGVATTPFTFISTDLLATKTITAQLNADLPSGLTLTVGMGLGALTGSGDVSNSATQGPVIVLSGLQALNSTGTITYTAAFDPSAANSADFTATADGLTLERVITYTVTE